jgi:hypothetical protein
MKWRASLYRKSETLFSPFWFFLFVTLFACKDEEDPSIVGNWSGTRSEVTVSVTGIPLPYTYTDDGFDALVEFKSDGSVSITEEGQTAAGTYEVSGKTLSTNITFNTDFIDLSGTYTIKELTKSKLTLYIEREGTGIDPNTGATLTGSVRATLFFVRM